MPNPNSISESDYKSIPELDYATVRPLLKDGDIVLVRKGRKWTSLLIKFFTNSEYYHAAVALALTSESGIKRWFVVEQHNGGQRIAALSTYCDYDIIRLDADFDKFGQYLIETSGAIDYSYADSVSSWLRENFGIVLPDFKGQMCSEMVATFLTNAGYELPTIITPQGLFLLFGDKLLYKVRPSFNDAKPRVFVRGINSKM